MAVVIAQAMNHGNLVVAKTSDMACHVPETTYQQYLRQGSLRAPNDRISNGIAALPSFRITHSISTGSMAASTARSLAWNGRL